MPLESVSARPVVSLCAFADSPADVAVVEIFPEERVAIGHPDEVTRRA
jgi:hypothetical protein